MICKYRRYKYNHTYTVDWLYAISNILPFLLRPVLDVGEIHLDYVLLNISTTLIWYMAIFEG